MYLKIHKKTAAKETMMINRNLLLKILSISITVFSSYEAEGQNLSSQQPQRREYFKDLSPQNMRDNVKKFGQTLVDTKNNIKNKASPLFGNRKKFSQSTPPQDAPPIPLCYAIENLLKSGGTVDMLHNGTRDFLDKTSTVFAQGPEKTIDQLSSSQQTKQVYVQKSDKVNEQFSVSHTVSPQDPRFLHMRNLLKAFKNMRKIILPQVSMQPCPQSQIYTSIGPLKILVSNIMNQNQLFMKDKRFHVLIDDIKNIQIHGGKSQKSLDNLVKNIGKNIPIDQKLRGNLLKILSMAKPRSSITIGQNRDKKISENMPKRRPAPVRPSKEQS
jgi:hypothetical protein